MYLLDVEESVGVLDVEESVDVLAGCGGECWCSSIKGNLNEMQGIMGTFSVT